MELIDNSYLAITRYFKRLSTFGYTPDNEVFKMITLFAIQEFLDKYLLSEIEYRQIERTINCLWGTSCLLPYPEYVVQHTVVATDKEAYWRFTEDSENRSTENIVLRIVQ